MVTGKYKGWLPVDVELDDTPEPEARLHLETMIAVVAATPIPSVDPWSKILTSLMALSVAHRSAHWRSKGDSFYGDHLMFEKMYDGVNDEVDAVAEKMMGLTGVEQSLDPSFLLAGARESLRQLNVTGADSLLTAERAFVQLLQGLLAECDFSDGSQNMLQGILDTHEKNVYFLMRRFGLASCIVAPNKPQA